MRSSCASEAGESVNDESLDMIRTGSPLAVILASIVVTASSDTLAIDRYMQPKAAYVRAKLKSSEKLAWTSAIANDDAGTLMELLAQNDPASLVPLTMVNGKSALMVAAKKGDQALAEHLMNAGSNVNETTDTQGTPFMFAVLGGHLDMARWLLEQGADINTVGSNGWTALTIAAAKGNVPILQWLIGQGADTQVRDVYRFTPLLRAADNGFVEAAAVLLSLVETDVNARDEHDNTALHHAISAGDEAMVSLLLEHHADPTIVNRSGITADELAQKLSTESQSILKMLNKAK